jgi:hypothetical protein
MALDIKLKARNKHLVFYLFEVCANDDALTTVHISGVTRKFFGGRGGVVTPGICLGGSTESVEGRGQRELGSGGESPLFRVSLNLQMSEIRILIRLL